jgi:hypothetical protein
LPIDYARKWGTEEVMEMVEKVMEERKDNEREMTTA